jgi:hypothetical protein
MKKLLCKLGIHDYRKDIKYRFISVGYGVPREYRKIHRYQCACCLKKTEELVIRDNMAFVY